MLNFTNLIPFCFYKIFFNNHNPIYERFTNNNFPRKQIKWIMEQPDTPKPKKKVYFSDEISIYHFTE